MSNFKKLAALLMFSAVLSIGAAGCGGGDDSEDPAPAPVETTTTDTAASDLTQDELIAEGDDICAEVNAAVGTISSSTTADPSIQESQIADIYAGMADRLSELGTPTDGDAPTEVIDAAETLADSSSADGEAALTEFQTAATDYGFKECGEAPAAPSSSSGGSSGSDPSTVPADPGYTPPATTPAPAAPAPATPPSTGGGVAPAPAPAPGTGGSSGGSSGGGGGIGPG